MTKKKKKASGKAVAIGAGVFVVLALIGGVKGAITADAEPSPEPIRAVATAVPEPTAPPTATPEPTPTPYLIHRMDPYRTVYVSRNGVIHLESDCSGMKNYTEMTLEEADAGGYEYCSRCIG
ncbi:MAG: hypothetical protein J6T26_01260 [Firmicutes bacterium]|nr:hypothetical protein [Bacillota bacterium]